MWRIALALIAALGFGLIVVAAQSLRRPLVRVVRALLAGLAFVLALGGLAIGVTGIADEIWWAAVMGGGILLVGLRLGWALRRPRRPRPVASVPSTRPDDTAGDPWARFESSLDWVGRQQARRSRKAIAGFVAERESPSLTVEHRALLLSCEKRVPELVEACVERGRNASARERDRYIDETLARLDQLAAEADRARREVREADDRRLQVLHRYFDGVAGKDDGRPDRS